VVTRLTSVVAVLGACVSSPSPPGVTIGGRYDVTSAPGCIGSPLDIEVVGLGVSLYANRQTPLALAADGADSYSASSCLAVECQSMDGGIAMFTSAHLERRSSTTIHGTYAVLQQRIQCTNDVCPAGFGSDAPSCDFDATLVEPAPVITSVSPSTVSSSDCSKPLTIRGGYFKTGVRVAYETAVPSCSSPTTSRGGASTCDLIVDHATATTITAHFASCPQPDEPPLMGTTLPLVIDNPSELDGSGNMLPGLEGIGHVELGP